MSQLVNLTTFPTNYEAAISWISHKLSDIDLSVIPSFDLKTAKAAHTGFICPHHGSVDCDCQIMVLLVYDGDEGPVSLVVHSQDGNTYLFIISAPGLNEHNPLVGKIFHTMENQNLVSSR